MKRNNFFLILVMCQLVLVQCAGTKVSKNFVAETNVPRVDFKRTLKKLSTPWVVQRVSPVVSEDFIFQATTSGLIGFSKDGKELWKFPVKDGVLGTPLYYQRKVFFGAQDGYFYCLGAHDGKLVWKRETDRSVVAQPVGWKHSIYFVTTGNELYALHADTGKGLWHYKRAAQPLQVQVLGGHALSLYGESVYAGFSDGYITHLSAASGSVLWAKKIGEGVRFTDIISAPYVDKKQVIVLDYEGELHSLDKTSGALLWKSSLGGIRFFFINNGFIYVTTANNDVAALRYERGAVVWKQHVEGGSLTAPVILDNRIYVGSGSKYLHVLSTEDGHAVWRYRTKYGFTASPTVFGTRVYAFSNSSRLIVFKQAM